MLPLGMMLMFAGYGVGSWGYLLVRGDNITLREWFSPLTPFTGPLDANGKVPQGSLLPTGKKAAATTGKAAGKGGKPAPHDVLQ